MHDKTGDDSGDGTIHRHDAPLPDDTAIEDAALIEAVTDHVERHVGPVETVYHEIASTYVHLDVLHVPPDDERPVHVFVTCGMSARPMTTPDDIGDGWRHAELMIVLPAEWPVGEDAFEDERHWWPVGLLKELGRLPHAYGTWLGPGHTVPNGDPAEPYAEDVAFTGAIIVPPLSFDEAVHELVLPGGATARFWCVLPLYAEEMALKLREGSDALFERFDDAGVSDVVDPDRPNVALD